MDTCSWEGSQSLSPVTGLGLDLVLELSTVVTFMKTFSSRIHTCSSSAACATAAPPRPQHPTQLSLLEAQLTLPLLQGAFPGGHGGVPRAPTPVPELLVALAVTAVQGPIGVWAGVISPFAQRPRRTAVTSRSVCGSHPLVPHGATHTVGAQPTAVGLKGTQSAGHRAGVGGRGPDRWVRITSLQGSKDPRPPATRPFPSTGPASYPATGRCMRPAHMP